jgi:hypothetical protein
VEAAVRKLKLLTPPPPAATIDRPPTILEATEDGDVDALARAAAAIVIRILREQANASRDLPPGVEQAPDERRVA